MDPNATLAELREYVRQVLYAPNELCGENVSGMICSLFESLDEWIKKGGFLPKEWEKKK